MIRPLPALLLLAGCDSVGGWLGTGHPPEDWRLIALYDATSVPALDGPLGELTWANAPSPGMVASCGPARGPVGLGVTEAEALLTRRTSALAIVLWGPDKDALRPECQEWHEGTPFPERLTREDVVVTLDPDTRPRRLEPAVMPRALRVDLDGVSPLERALVAESLTRRLCLEHTVGRGWIGGSRQEEVRAALLLESRAEAVSPSAFFVGQGGAPGGAEGVIPVPALLGSPDACLEGEAPVAEALRTPFLRAGAVWSAGIRVCEEDQPDPRYTGSVLPLAKSHPGKPGTLIRPQWAELDVARLLAAPEKGGDALVVGRSPAWNAREILSTTGTAAAHGGATAGAGGRGAVETAGTAASLATGVDADRAGTEAPLPDVLAHVPYEYPLIVVPPSRRHDDVGQPSARAFTLLLIPAWQLETGDGSPDPVGDMLNDPSRLSVKLRSRPECGWDEVPAQLRGEPWSELNPSRANPLLDSIGWGAEIDMMASRRSIVTPGFSRVSGASALVAHRSVIQGMFVAASVLLATFAVAGLRRLRVLWEPEPEVRLGTFAEPEPPVEES